MFETEAPAAFDCCSRGVNPRHHVLCILHPNMVASIYSAHPTLAKKTIRRRTGSPSRAQNPVHVAPRVCILATSSFSYYHIYTILFCAGGAVAIKSLVQCQHSSVVYCICFSFVGSAGSTHRPFSLSAPLHFGHERPPVFLHKARSLAYPIGKRRA